MKDDMRIFLGIVLVVMIIIGIATGVYFFCKWNNAWIDEIKSYCPEGTKLTDYSYARSHLGIDGELYGLECDGEILDFKVKIENYRDCVSYNKWDQCNLIDTKYNSTKIDRLVGVSEQ